METQVLGWVQNYDPLNNMWLSAFVAFLPIAMFFVSLVVLKTKGHTAGFLTVALAAIIAVFVYGMPADKMLWSFVYGGLYGVWPIAWIIIAAIFLYKLTVKSGYFDILRESIIAITPDQRIQVILIGFCFGAFLEGAIGFGGPVAITARRWLLGRLGYQSRRWQRQSMSLRLRFLRWQGICSHHSRFLSPFSSFF